MEIHEWLAGDPSAPATARRLLSTLADDVSGEVLDDVKTVATEIVTNSVRHAGLQPGDRIEFCVDVGPRNVRVEVTDPGLGFTPPTGPMDILAPGGRGLLILRELCQRWGVQTTPGGCLVWCEIVNETENARNRVGSNA